MNQFYHLEKLGQNLKYLRLRRGLTQVELARRAGVPRLKVIEVEAGKDSVAIGSYAKISTALGVELAAVPVTRPTLEDLKEFFDGDDQ